MILAIPCDGLSQAFDKIGAGAKTEGVAGATRIEGAAWLAVRLCSIPNNVAGKACLPGDQMHEVANADLTARAEVHWLTAIVALCGHHDAFGGIVYVKEFARRGARAPDFNHAVAAMNRVNALFDQRRDDVRDRRVKLIARPIEIDRQQVDAV